MVTLRPFQQKLEADIYAAWETPGVRNVMPVAATGSGKTVVLSKLMADEPGASVAIAHRQELVSQISLALARNGVRHRLIGSDTLKRMVSAIHTMETGGNWLDPNARAGVAGVDTIIRMSQAEPWFKAVRLQVQDEGHHVLADNKWGQAASLFPHARGLFPTATPRRADGKGLGRHADGLADALVLAPAQRDIINMGFLTDYRIFAPPSALHLTDDDISQATGDYNQDRARKATKAAQIVGDVVGHYLAKAQGKLGVTFAVDVEAATELAAAYRAKGVPAEVVSAKTPDLMRHEILRKFARRELLQLVNVDLFGEGFDLPAIECVSFARPTASFSLYTQQFGRALRLLLDPQAAARHNALTDAGRLAQIRASSKPVALVFDHVGNVIRHNGPPDRPQAWTLDRRDRRESRKSDAIPYRVCVNPECNQPYERILTECPFCHAPPPPPAGRRAPDQVDGDLHELDADILAKFGIERARIDGDFYPPVGMPFAAQLGARKRWVERQASQHDLRDAIAWWAGLQAAKGLNEREGYKRFWFKFGVDVASAQTLGAAEAGALAERVRADMAADGLIR